MLDARRGARWVLVTGSERGKEQAKNLALVAKGHPTSPEQVWHHGVEKTCSMQDLIKRFNETLAKIPGVNIATPIQPLEQEFADYEGLYARLRPVLDDTLVREIELKEKPLECEKVVDRAKLSKTEALIWRIWATKTAKQKADYSKTKIDNLGLAHLVASAEFHPVMWREMQNVIAIHC